MSNKGYETIATDEDDEMNQPSHPMQSANFLSILTLWWMNSTLKIGSINFQITFKQSMESDEICSRTL